jgi:hypothetical protein
LKPGKPPHAGGLPFSASQGQSMKPIFYSVGGMTFVAFALIVGSGQQPGGNPQNLTVSRELRLPATPNAVLKTGANGAVTAAVAGTDVLNNSSNLNASNLASGTVPNARLDGELSAIAGLTSAADKIPYFTGSGTAAVGDYSSFSRTLDALTSASSWRTTLQAAPYGTVIITHKDGPPTPYLAAANTDAARGTALIAAVAARIDDDQLELGPGRYDVGTANLDLSAGGTLSASMRGAGMGRTVIRGNIGVNDGAIVRPGSTSVVQDLTIEAPDDEIVFHYGSNANIPYTIEDAKLINVELRGSNDNFVMRATGDQTAKVTCWHCRFTSLWDSTIADGNTTLIFHDCVVESLGPATISGANGNAIALSLANGATIEINGGRVEASGHPGVSTAIATGNTGGTLRLRGVRLVSEADTTARDLSILSLGTTIEIDAATEVASSKVYNPLTQTITRMPFHGLTPSDTFLSLTNIASASAGRDILGATSGRFSSAMIPTDVIYSGGALGTPSSGDATNLTATTPTANDNDTSIATTAFVRRAVNGSGRFAAFTAGRYYLPPGSLNASAVALSADTIYAGVFEVGHTWSPDQIGLRVQSNSGTATHLRFAIFAADSEGKPGALVAESASTAIVTPPDNTVASITATLTPGIYYIGVVANGTVTSVWVVTDAFSNPYQFGLAATNEQAARVTGSHAYGAMPNPFPAESFGNVGGTPAVFLRDAP